MALKKVILEDIDQELELLCCHGTIHGHPLAIISAYYPPSCDKSSDFNDAIAAYIHNAQIKLKRPLIIIAGDFNDVNLKQLLIEHSDLIPVNKDPTRNLSILDQVLMNKPGLVKSVAVCPPLQSDDGRTESDHKIVEVSLRLVKGVRPVWETYEKRQMGNHRCESFLEELRVVDWSSVLKQKMLDKKVDNFNRIVANLINRHFPKKLCKMRSDDAKWMTDHIRREVNKRKKIFKKEGKSEKWQKQKAHTDSLISRRKKSYWEGETKAIAATSPANWWRATRAVMSDRREGQWDPGGLRADLSEEEVAEWMVNYFTDITADFEPLGDQPLEDEHIPPFLLVPAQVEKILLKQKVTSATVPGDLPPKIFKRSICSIVRPLTSIYNCVLLTGGWPSQWKLETGIPIPKVPNPGNIDQVRLIRLTPVFAKAGESIILAPLLESIIPNMKKTQFGGLPGIGTTEALISLGHCIATGTDPPNTAAIVTSYDFSKAFDRTSHQIILSELKRLGAPPWILNIVRSYLTMRRLSVRVRTSEKHLHGGSSQGAKLGVIMFNVSVDNVELGFDGQVFTIRYVDDINNVEIIKWDLRTQKNQESLGDQQGQICLRPEGSEFAFARLVENAADLKMSLNPLKTKLTICHRTNHNLTTSMAVPGTNAIINPDQPLRVLGFMLDNKISNPESHIDMLERKTLPRLWILSGLKRAGVDQEGLLTVYRAMIRSILEYVSPTFHTWLSIDQATRIERIQKKALKIIFGWEKSYRSALVMANLERLDHRRDKALLDLAKKMISDPRFNDYFPRICENGRPNTRQIGQLDTSEEWNTRALYRSPIFTMRRAIRHGYVVGSFPEVRYAR